jgi:hypothetical protein
MSLSALSMFFGILIRMYNNGEHNPPHFHAFYQGYEASYSLEGELIEGNMPARQHKLIAAWSEIHKDELIANWELAINEQPLFRIDPLR